MCQSIDRSHCTNIENRYDFRYAGRCLLLTVWRSGSRISCTAVSTVLLPVSTFFFRWICTAWIYHGTAVVPRIVWMLGWLRHLPGDLLLPLLHGWQERWGGWRQLPSLWSGHVRTASKHLLHGADPIQDPRAERHRWHVSQRYLGDLLLSFVYAGAIGARSQGKSRSHVHRSLLISPEEMSTEVFPTSHHRN